MNFQSSNIITDRLLRSWVRCKRKAWLDRFGNQTKRVWSAHRALQLDHQQRCLAELLPMKAGKGLRACQQGKKGVIGLRLKGVGPSGELLEAHPPLLERMGGECKWGKYVYRPVLTRQGRKITREHRLTLCFVGLLLEQVQKASVTQGVIVSKAGEYLERQTISLSEKLQDQLKVALIKLNADLKRDEIPQITSDRRKCSLCSWRGICNNEASEQGQLSEISGIGAKREQMLQELGINKLQDLAKTNPQVLSKSLNRFGEQHAAIAHQLVAQAEAQHTGKEKRLSRLQALPELINAPGVLLYDIEADPDNHDDFLHGFVRLNRRNNGEWDLQAAKYQPILTLSDHGEDICWKRINRKLAFFKDWPILHYGETESRSILSLAKRQGAQDIELKELRKRFIDIHARLRLYWLLPLNSYGLKTVASWTNFQWSHAGAEGARALMWWRQWKGAGDKKRGHINALKWLLKYNHDDCLATWSVASWLLKQDSFD
ncbi:TM0106 family RecB-like putative nuclease [Prochlorococcus sp. MIT 1307]|uniref:TM0106 family RecB-like putative nuclease n=1 Tax=Prochlorococcus sp. MIT 1307 TaxID=3096219 RepID=UPI002A74E49D|nr:TM0106 family RecB-like putative nuclease [Prochlorococcus sp. MIT 1307]